ncbi:hypothetical protein MNBD_NITROSPINAE03-92 [hydrothermal vent metagenome]|uniref:Radical SAM core domain-containing protein n=1 Tax=hydrothermal vent metagenome TaxID=652676 RepID=A0A3B1C6U2_9ZZZZ
MDKYKIDGHKLSLHVSRVNKWLNGKNIFPVYVEISPSGACNHRCTFCGLDFMGYKPRKLETGVLQERLTEMGKLGVKGAMYGGEGEPLLHQNLADIIHHTVKSGISAALTTNGVLLNQENAEKILADLDWMKASVNAGTPETYSKIHRTKEEDFNKVINNLRNASKIRSQNGYSCALGMQILIMPENRDEAVILAKIASDIGVDYLVIKPYSWNPKSLVQTYRDIKYSQFLDLAEDLEKFNTKDFRVIFRKNAMEKHDNENKSYCSCVALPFISYIDSGGSVWGCSDYLEDDRFYYGNIYDNTFNDIWNSETRKKSLDWVANEMDVNICRINCRMDEVNQYLWDILSPPPHVNFI